MNQKIEYISPFMKACGRTGEVLFSEFKPGKYAIITFCFILSQFQLAWWAEHLIFSMLPAPPLEKLIPPFSEITVQTFINLIFKLIPMYKGYLILIISLFIGQYILFGFLREVGKFMFLDNLVENKSAFACSFKKHSQLAFSSFICQMILFLVYIASVSSIIAITWHYSRGWIKMLMTHQTVIAPDKTTAVALLFSIVGFITVTSIAKIIQVYYKAFIIQIMYRDKIKVTAAIKTFLHYTATKPLAVIFFLLFHICMVGATEFLLILLSILTLGMGFILLNIPLFGFMLILPFCCIYRLFSFEFLGQFTTQEKSKT